MPRPSVSTEVQARLFEAVREVSDDVPMNLSHEEAVVELLNHVEIAETGDASDDRAQSEVITTGEMPATDDRDGDPFGGF